MADRPTSPKHRLLPPSTCLMPLPVVLVTCRSQLGQDNIITIAWTGVVCSDPPMLSIAVRPNRLSHEFLDQNGDFVVHVPSADQVAQTDLCGITSGRDQDKFKETGWTAGRAAKVNAALINECPLALECRTRQKLSLGSHDLYIAEILALQVHDHLVDPGGWIRIDELKPLSYCPNSMGAGEYRGLGEMLAQYGCARKQRKKM